MGVPVDRLPEDAYQIAHEADVDRCECCGQRLRGFNPHHICRDKVDLLKRLYRLWLEGHDWVRVEEGYNIQAGQDSETAAYCARQHADRLKYFGLVNHRGPRSAEYQINANGLKFLQGALRVPATIWCRDGRAVYASRRMVTIHEVKKLKLDKAYWDAMNGVKEEYDE